MGAHPPRDSTTLRQESESLALFCFRQAFICGGLPIREELKQNNAIVHGGAIASLIDSAMAFAIIPLLTENERTTTVDLTIHYLRPLVEGVAKASARVVRAGRRIVVVSAEVLDDQERLAATAMSTYARLTPDID